MYVKLDVMLKFEDVLETLTNKLAKILMHEYFYKQQ